METLLPFADSFELLELPDGRWCVARTAPRDMTALVAGSFARLATVELEHDPVGFYSSRDDAELAIQRNSHTPPEPDQWWLKWSK